MHKTDQILYQDSKKSAINKSRKEISQKIKSHYDFLKNALEDIKTPGSIASSSRFLVSKLLEKIDFSQTKSIVEFGAGLGSVTFPILQNMSPQAQFLSFEINNNFLESLAKIKDSRFKLINDSAANLCDYVENESVDVIVSSLPLKNIDDQIKEEIIKASLLGLKKGGLYIQYQYSLSDYSWLKKHFEEVELDFTALNIPPAFVYICKK